jgi:hypothetical protein
VGPHDIGKLAESTVARDIQNRGLSVVATHITVDTKAGTRVVDIVTRDAKGSILLIEVKANASVYAKAQKSKDLEIASNGGIARGRRANNAELSGSLQANTVEARVNTSNGCVSYCGSTNTTPSSLSPAASKAIEAGRGGLY